MFWAGLTRFLEGSSGALALEGDLGHTPVKIPTAELAALAPSDPA